MPRAKATPTAADSSAPEAMPTEDQPVLKRSGDELYIIGLGPENKHVSKGCVKRIGAGVFLWMSVNGDEGRRSTEWEALLALGYCLDASGMLKAVRSGKRKRQEEEAKKRKVRIQFDEQCANPATADAEVVRKFDRMLERNVSGGDGRDPLRDPLRPGEPGEPGSTTRSSAPSLAGERGSGEANANEGEGRGREEASSELEGEAKPTLVKPTKVGKARKSKTSQTEEAATFPPAPLPPGPIEEAR